MPETLTGQRVSLRAFQPEDRDAVSRFTSDPRVATMLGAIPCPNPPLAVDGWMLLNDALERRGQKYAFAVTTAEDGLVGSVTLTLKAGDWHLSYWIGMPHIGHGYSVEAGTLVLDWARDALGIARILAGHHEDNPASGRVLEKLGLCYTGVTEPRFSLARGHSVPTRVYERVFALVAA